MSTPTPALNAQHAYLVAELLDQLAGGTLVTADEHDLRGLTAAQQEAARSVGQHLRQLSGEHMALHSLAQAGQLMRELQRQYFKSRDRAVLIASKDAERAFDALVAVVLGNRPEGDVLVKLDGDY